MGNVSPECLSDAETSLAQPSSPTFDADWENECIKTVKSMFLTELEPKLASSVPFVPKPPVTENFAVKEFSRGNWFITSLLEKNFKALAFLEF